MRAPTRITATVVVACGLLLGAIPATVWAASPGEDREAVRLAREIVAREGFQAELCEIEGQPGAGPDELDYWSRRRPSYRSDRGDDPAGAALSTVLLWGGLLAAVIVGIVWSSRQFQRHPDGDAVIDPEVDAPRPSSSPLDPQPSANARELAQQGHFAEAMRALLRDTTRALGRSQRMRLAPSLTSREIAARLNFDGPRRASYDALVRVVETSTFGTAHPTAVDWNHAVSQYRVLREHWEVS